MAGKKEGTTFPTGPLSYSRTVQALKEALSQEFTSYGLDPSEREVKRLFWRDDMENYTRCRWIPGYPVGTEVFYADAIPAFEGDYVLACQHPTDRFFSCASVYFSQIARNQKVSVELRWYSRLNIYNFFLGLFNTDRAGSSVYGSVSWNGDRPGWAYEDPNGNVVFITGGEEAIHVDAWNYLRMVLDYEKNSYARIQTNLIDVDLSGLPLRTRPDVAGQSRIAFAVDLRAAAVLPYPFYVDDVRLYLNEV